MSNSTSSTNAGAELQKQVRHSLLSAALDRYLGLRGFISVSKFEVGGQFDFDFHQFHTDASIKVFRELNSAEIARYRTLPKQERVILIVDCELLRTNVDRDRLHFVEEDDGRIASGVNYLYWSDALWKFASATDPESSWSRVVPVERQRCIDALDALK